MNQIERGTGRKLLLIHGLGGSWRSWTPILDALSLSRRVIAIDLPGHGETPAEHDSGTFNGLVGTVASGLERVVGSPRPLRRSHERTSGFGKRSGIVNVRRWVQAASLL